MAALKAGQCGWDLLISDHAMPELSGTELVHQLRKVHPELPCLIITGYAEGEAVAGRPDDVMANRSHSHSRSCPKASSSCYEGLSSLRIHEGLIMSKRNRPVVPGKHAGQVATDMVDEASMESFPASDPPPWTGGLEYRLAEDDNAKAYSR